MKNRTKTLDPKRALRRLQRVVEKHAGNMNLMGVKVLDLHLVCQLAELGLESDVTARERAAAGDYVIDCEDCDGKGWRSMRCNNCNTELTDKNAPDDPEYQCDVCDHCAMEDAERGHDRHGNPRPT